MNEQRDDAVRASRLVATVAAELRTLAFIAAVAAVFATFRVLLGFATFRWPKPLPFIEYIAAGGTDALQLFLVGVLMWAVVEPVRRLGPEDGARRVVAVVLAVVAGTLIASAAWAWWLVLSRGQTWAETWKFAHIFLVRYGLLASLVVVVGEFHRRESRSLDAMRAAETDRHALEQQTLQARLKTLEAQIEPHFLFNTLANVRRLYETDADAGEVMLERLMRYLEVALPSMRSDRSTLGREAELIGAYLDLQRVRMGKRLAYRVDVAPALGHLEVPPMMLLTLVENAIKHGLAPQRQGGRVDVSARLEAGELLLEVSDTGHGFGGQTSGGGTGLANIRARLQALFGSAADLSLVAREPQGIRAAIRMPMPGAAA